MEPSLSHGPLAFDRRRGNPQRFSSLFDIEAAEEAQFDNLGLTRIQLFEPGQRLVDLNQIRGAIFGDNKSFIERSLVYAAAALFTAPRFGIVQQDAPHDLRGDSEKVSAILPADVPLIHQLEIGFVDERGGLKGMAGPLAAELAAGDALQLVVNQRGQ